MSLEVKVPVVGESITEVTIAKWLKKDGETVQMDEIICELESDKATFELNAEAAGTLKIIAKEGETIPIGTVICKIEESGAAKPATVKAEAAPTSKSDARPTPTGKVKEMIVPTVGESITEVTVANWMKNDGDFVKAEEPICEIESDKATFEINAEAQGILRIVAKNGDTIPIGATICKIEVMEGTTAAQAEIPKQAVADDSRSSSRPDASSESYAKGHPSPAAAKVLAEKGISPAAVTGTGPGGRITKEDAQNTQSGSKPAEPKQEKPAAAPVFSSGVSREVRREKMTNLRKTIARRLVAAKNETAMLTTFNEVDMKPVMDMRGKYKDKFKEKYGVGLGFMSFFTRAVCMTLKEWPAVNAQIEGDEIVYHDFCDISVAVSSPRGLVVPVVRNAEHMSFEQIEAEIVRLAAKARDGKLTIEEMTGGTFSITNGGIFGSMLSTPIINQPQSAILGMHNIVERPIALNGQVAIRPIMYVALSYDHRIVDGRESVSFLYRVKEYLEDPNRLLIGV